MRETLNFGFRPTFRTSKCSIAYFKQGNRSASDRGRSAGAIHRYRHWGDIQGLPPVGGQDAHPTRSFQWRVKGIYRGVGVPPAQSRILPNP